LNSRSHNADARVKYYYTGSQERFVPCPGERWACWVEAVEGHDAEEGVAVVRGQQAVQVIAEWYLRPTHLSYFQS
jgi:hypothetical protein